MFGNRTSCHPPSGPATIPLPKLAMASRPSRSSARHSGRSSSPRETSVRMNGTSQNGRKRLDPQHMQLAIPQQRRPRVALYSHDTMGLGHLRRNLLIAQALAKSPLQATSLLITGAHEANFFSLPQGADCITLPRLRKEPDGNYCSGQLAISIEDLISLRAESISSALASFQPDLLLVDKVPAGAFGELLPALRLLSQDSTTRCVLGIRDVLDNPATVREEFQSSNSFELIEEFFEEIWVYGDQRVYDPVHEYQWPAEVATKVRFTGYLNQASRLTPAEAPLPFRLGNPDDKLILCTLGGGQDGQRLGQAFLEALPEKDHFGVLLAGPFMNRSLLRSLREIATERGNSLVLDFTPEANQLIQRADRVIAMGGYNTVCSILSYQKNALIVPRVIPREEQWIRAERLKQFGLLDSLHPESLSAASLRDWITSDLPRPANAQAVIGFNGLQVVQQLCSCLVGDAALAPVRESV